MLGEFGELGFMGECKENDIYFIPTYGKK